MSGIPTSPSLRSSVPRAAPVSRLLPSPLSALLLGVVLVFLLVQPILSDAAAARITVEPSDSAVGESVTILLDTNGIENPSLRLYGGGSVFRYGGNLDEPLLFTPRTAGDYVVALIDGERPVEETLFRVLDVDSDSGASKNMVDVPDAEGAAASSSTSVPPSAAAPFIATEKGLYAPGESVIILGDAPVEGYRLAIETPQGRLRYSGALAFPISYEPPEPGEYRIVLEPLAIDGAAATAAEATFFVGDFSGSENAAPLTSDEMVIADAEPPLLRPRRALELRNSESRILESSIRALVGSVAVSGSTAGPAVMGTNGTVEENVTIPLVEILLERGPVERIRLADVRLRGGEELGLDPVPASKIDVGKRHVIEAFAIDAGQLNFTNGTATRTAVGTELWKCRSWQFETQACTGSWERVGPLTPGEEYAIELFPGDPGYAETGVASINTERPLYHPGETVSLTIVVLDRAGYLTSDADVTLEITAPNGTATLLTSAGPDASILEESLGIFTANHSSTGEEGVYSLLVRAIGLDVNNTMRSDFTVLASFPYDIRRESPVTTDPWLGPFSSSVTITALAGDSLFDYTEVLPGAFTVYDAGGATEEIVDGKRLLIWRGLSSGATVEYVARPPYAAPDLYTLGPSYVESHSGAFTEARPWYLAIDPSETLSRYNASTGNSGYVRNTNCGAAGAATQTMDGSAIYVGRYTTGSGREYRMFTSFDTSGIPDDATINSATLYVYLDAEAGEADDVVAVYTCDYGATLTNADFTTTLGYDHGNIFTGSSSTGQYHSLALATGSGNISLTGNTQFCIWIDGGCSDTNDLFETLSTNAGNRPYLMVNYTSNAAPTQGTPALTSSLGYNETTEDLTCYNESTADADGDDILNIFGWNLNGSTFETLNAPFEGNSNATWTRDYSGNRNNGTVSGATWNLTGGKVGGAYEFDGTNDHIRFQGDDLSSTSDPFSVSFWFKPSASIGSGILANITLVEKREGAGNNDWRIYFDNGDAGRLRITSFAGDVQTATDSWSASTWYHVVFVYAGDTNSTVYINGSSDNYAADFDIGTLTQSAEDIWFGTRYDQSEDFNGSIDEVRIYARALSESQVLALFGTYYSIIESDETEVGDNWTCTVTPNDGYLDGSAATSNDLVVVASAGSPPNITAVSDAPDPVALGGAVTVTATVSDPDSDLVAVVVQINGTNHSMSNTTPTSWNVTIDTTGFATGALPYTVYATDSASKRDSYVGGTVTVTNALSVDVTTDQSSYYVGDIVNATTNVTLVGTSVDANVTNDIILVETTSEILYDSWWNTSLKHRVRFTLDDTSGENRADYWVSVPVVIDADCSLDAHNTSLRLVDDDGLSLSFLQWNVTTCPGDSAYTQSLWVSFRLDLDADETRGFYLYADNESGHSQAGTEQEPMLIVFVDQGTGSGSFPDTADIGSRYDTALSNLGLSSTGFYDTLSTSRSANDVAFSSVSPYPYVHYSAGSKYRNSWSSTEAANLFQFVNQSGSLLMTGSELGFDANEDGWIFDSVFINLTHMASGLDDDTGASNIDIVSSHPIRQYLGPSGSSFQISDSYPDGYSTIGGPVAVNVYDWDAGNPQAGTANDGLYDTSCEGMCGKTVYYGGAIVDTGGDGISVGTDREEFIRGVLAWFLTNRSADFSQGSEQRWIARQTGSTGGDGLLALEYDTTTWANATYAAMSLAEKGGYDDGFDYAFFTLAIDYSGYPNITAVADTPDPVPLGYELNITATVTDGDGNLDSVWVEINGTNYSLSNTSPTGWNVSIDTDGFALGLLTYTVYANDSDANIATPVQGTVTVSDLFQASVSTDQAEYVIGETVIATTQTYLGWQPTDAPITTDIIRGSADTQWWDTDWLMRRPFNLSSSDATTRTEEIVRMNITGLAGNITSCADELRIIAGAPAAAKIEIPFTVEDGDDSTWCQVRFLANVTAGTPTRYHAYYNNSGATDPGYAAVATGYVANPDMEAAASWTYTETETADTGAYTSAQSYSPTDSYNIYSGSSGTAGNYAEIYQDIALPCVGCSIIVSAYNRLESAGTTANSFYGQIIMGSTTLSSIGTPASADSPTDWAKRSNTYTTLSSSERLHLRLLTDVTFTGGSYGRRDVFWDDVAIRLSSPLSPTFAAVQQWESRDNGTSNAVSGLLSLSFDSSTYTNGTYSAVTFASKPGYSDASDWTTFLMKVNTTGYPQIHSVSDYPDPVLYGSTITFTVNVTDQTGIDAAWIIIDGTTRYDLSNASSGSADLWQYVLDTTGLDDGVHTYYAYANDTDNNQQSNGSYSFTVLKQITVVVTGDKSSYTTGDLAVFTTNATIVDAVSGASVTTDIIMGTTERPWWNIAWARRKPLTVTEAAGVAHVDAIVEVNVTGLNGNISDCDELRIVDYGSSAAGTLVEAKIFGGDDSTRCRVRFYANLSASESSTTRFYAYYNNSGATAQSVTNLFYEELYVDDGENATLRSGWTRDPFITDGASCGWWSWGDPAGYQVGGVDAQPENDVTGGAGVYALFTGVAGDNTACTGYDGDIDGGDTSASSPIIDLSGWKRANLTVYRWFYSNDNGGNNDDTCALYASTNGGTTFPGTVFELSDDNVGGDTDAYNQWTQAGFRLESVISSFNSQFRLLAFADDYGDGDVLECGMDEFNITGHVSKVTASGGNEERWILRTTNTTEANGTADAYFDTTSQEAGSYVAISLVTKSPYDAGSDGYPFTISPDAPPTVTLINPGPGALTNLTTITFQCSATDDFSLVNMTLYNDLDGSFGPNGTDPLSGISDSSSFIRSGILDGTYTWNCLAFDNSSQSSFAPANRTFTVDATAPAITLSAPPHGAILNTSGVGFRFSVNDVHDIATCSLLINGSENKTDATITKLIPQYFSQSFPDGKYSWSIRCTDQAGNVNVSVTRNFTVAQAYTIRNGTWYERSDFTPCTSGQACGIDLAKTRNATGHSVVFNPVQPAQTVTVVEAASPFMGTNGAFIPGGNEINFSGEFLTNPVSQGLITWALYREDLSLTRTLICQDASNPLFSSMTGSCAPATDIYLAPEQRLLLTVLFNNDETHTISLTHYWDAARASFVNISLTTIGFLTGSITWPISTPYSVSQNDTFTLNCTYNCSYGTCVDTVVYAEYDAGSGYVPISAIGGIALNGSQTNPVTLGNISSGGSETASFTLLANQTGSWPVQCSATDVAETVNASGVTINVGDNTAPMVELIAPGDNNWTNLDPAEFTFYVNDSSSIENCTLILNGSMNETEYIITADANNTIYSSLESGMYEWTVICYDEGGLSGIGSPNRTVKVDTVTPNVVVNYPTNESVDTSTVGFNWTVTENWPGINVTCNLTIDGSVNATNLSVEPGSPYLYEESGFSTGNHTWSVSCWDPATNTNTSSSYWFYVTDSAPVVILISPPDGTLDNMSDWTLVYQVIENNGLQYCDLYLDGSYDQGNSTPVNLTGDNNFTVTVADGLHNWTVECNDTGGQSHRADVWWFTADTTPPTITPIIPADLDNFSSTPNTTIRFNVTDNLAANISCELTINGIVNATFNSTDGNTNETTLVNQSDGAFVWNVRCVDEAGNANTSGTRTYYVDNVPTAYLVTPTSGNHTNSDVLTYFVDDNDEIANCSLYIDGSFNGSETEVVEGATNTFTVSGLTAGFHTWYVICADDGYFGNENRTDTWNFTYDTSAPTVIQNAPSNGTLNVPWAVFNWTASDDWSSTLTCDLTIDGEVNDTFTDVEDGIPYAVNVSGFSNGNHTWNVTCADQAGNYRTSHTWWFYVNIPPSVYLQSPPDPSFNSTGYWNLTYLPVINNVEDELADFANCSLYLNGAYNRTNDTVDRDENNSFILTGVGEGIYNWTVLCVENSGLSAWSETWRFIEDQTPPVPAITTPSPSWFNIQTPTIAFNITDNFGFNVTYGFYVDSLADAGATGEIPANSASSDALSPLSEGTHQVQLEARDRAGNPQNSTNITVNIDLTEPTITLLMPSPNNVTDVDTVLFNFSVDDNMAPTLSCNLTIDGNDNKTYPVVADGSYVNVSISGFSQGTHYWNVTCVDLAGNANTSETRQFSVDLYAPQISYIAPTPGNDSLRSTDTFTVNVSHVEEFPDTIILYVDGAPNVTRGYSGAYSNFTLAGLDDGVYTYYVWVNDTFGRTNRTETNTVRIDLLAPIIELIAPPEGSQQNSSVVEFSFNVTDSSEFLNCTLYLNGSPDETKYNLSPGVENRFVKEFVDGDHDWYINCTDQLGRENVSERRNFTVSIVLPAWTGYWYEHWAPIENFRNETAFIDLANIHPAPSNYVTANLTDRELFTVANATSSYFAGNGVFIPAGTQVNFSGAFEANETSGYVTWKLYATNESGDYLIAIRGNDNIAGTQLTPANSPLTRKANYNTTQDWYLSPTTRLQLIVNIYNFRNNVEFKHTWDDRAESWVFFDDSFYVLGDISLNLTEPNETITVTPEETFNQTCFVNCTYGTCLDTYVYAQYNSTYPAEVNWTNISGAGYLTLASGQTNPVFLGNLTGTTSVTFIINTTSASTNNVRCYAESFTGEVVSGSQAVYVQDRIPPIVNLTAPADGSHTNASSIAFFFNVSENMFLENCSLYINDALNDTKNASELLNDAENNFTVAGFAEGFYEWNVSCFDNSGNEGNSTTWNVTVDRTRPTITLLSPIDDANLTVTSVELNYTVTDNYASTLTCNVTLDGSVVNTSTLAVGQNESYLATGLGEGAHTWNVTCQDEATNRKTSETRTFNIFIAPTIRLLSPPNQTVTNNYTVAFYFNVSDDTGIENCSLLFNGSVNRTVPGTSIVLNGTSNISQNFTRSMNLTWAIMCYDNTTQRMMNTSETRELLVDRDPPVPSIETADGSWFSVSSPLIYFNITDNYDGLLAYTLYVDGSPNATGFATEGISVSGNLIGVDDGSHQVILEGEDDAGNRANSTPITIHVDTVAPNVTLLDPGNETSITRTSVALNFSVTDAMDGTLLCNLTLDNNVIRDGFTVPNGSNSTTNVSGLLSGYHHWNVTCVDEAGNAGFSGTFWFMIESPDLFVVDISFNESNPIEGDNITISANISNIGNLIANGIKVQFWRGDPSTNGTQINGNLTIPSLAINASAIVSVNYTTLIGRNLLFVLVDPPIATNGTIPEENESNNVRNETFHVGHYHIMAGNTTSSLRVDDGGYLPVFTWNVTNATGSNVFVVDTDSSVDFMSLRALGRDSAASPAFDDFAELDLSLNSVKFNDSINATWTSGGAPRKVRDFIVFSNTLANVSVVNSTNSTAFQTGILWDESDGGAEYTGIQDVIFITEVNESQEGLFGIYDFELRIPATLRDYLPGTSTVSFYTEVK